MLTCRDVAHRHASDFIDGQLSWRARLGVRLHLLLCDNCNRFIAQLRKVRVLLLNKSQSEAPLDPAAQELAIKLADIYAQQKKSSPPL